MNPVRQFAHFMPPCPVPTTLQVALQIKSFLFVFEKKDTKEFVDRDNQFVPTTLQPNLQKTSFLSVIKKQDGSPRMQKFIGRGNQFVPRTTHPST